MKNFNKDRVLELSRLEKRATKDQAFNNLVSLLDGESEDMEVTLAVLYSYFLPSTPKKTRKLDAFQWVNLAKAKKDVRFALTEVRCEDGCLIGTDGHRLHISPNSKGLDEVCSYDAGLNKVPGSEEWRFPPYKRVIPPEGDTVEVFGFSEKNLKYAWYKKKGKKLDLVSVGEHFFNKKYLLDALRYKEPLDKVCVSEKDGTMRMDYKDGSLALIAADRVHPDDIHYYL